MFEVALREALLANTALASAVEGISEGVLGQRTEFPWITFERSATNPTYSHDGLDPLQEIRILVKCWSSDEIESKAVAKIFIAALSTFDLQRAFESPAAVITESANRFLGQWATEEPEPAPKVYGSIVDCKIWYRET